MQSGHIGSMFKPRQGGGGVGGGFIVARLLDSERKIGGEKKNSRMSVAHAVARGDEEFRCIGWVKSTLDLTRSRLEASALRPRGDGKIVFCPFVLLVLLVLAALGNL